jgi:hypothetical protein
LEVGSGEIGQIMREDTTVRLCWITHNTPRENLRTSQPLLFYAMQIAKHTICVFVLEVGSIEARQIMREGTDLTIFVLV